MIRMCSFVMKAIAFAVIVAMLNVKADIRDDDCLLTNVYAKARMVFSSGTGNSDDPDSRFACVRSGGFQIELEDAEWRAFSNLCVVVSNHYPTILQNWCRYYTNEMVRFSVLNAVSFSGECVYTNFFERLASSFTPSHDADWQSLEYLVAPFGTPMEQHAAMFHDNQTISNILEHVATLAENGGSTNLVRGCRQRISGEVKQYLLENR